jgi:hypothetical protein
MVFQGEIDDIKACIMQNIEKGYERASIFSLVVKWPLRHLTVSR